MEKLYDVIYADQRNKHSKKPAYVRDMISTWYPGFDKLEMFARTRSEGWDVWGNQVENSINLEDFDSWLNS